MKAIYEITFKARVKSSAAFQKIHDSLKKHNIKYWTYDLQRLILVIRSEFRDTRLIEKELGSTGMPFSFVKIEQLSITL